MLFFHISIHDDRGRRVRLIALRTSFLFPRRPALLPGARDTERTAEQRAQMILARARRPYWTEEVTWRDGLKIIAGVTIALAGIFLTRSWLPPPQPQPPHAYFYPLLGLLAGAIIGNIVRSQPDKKNAPQVRATLLAERLCPSCAYDLSNTPRDADGLTPCPECGAAWRV